MGGTGLNSHLGRVPEHLLTKKQLDEREDKQLQKSSKDKHEVDGYVITKKMKFYCEERIFGGVHRSLKEWAEHCGVKEKDIRRWNKMAGVLRYIDELREFRIASVNEAVSTSLSSTINNMVTELDKLIKLDTTIVIGRGKRQRVLQSPGLVEQKRRAIIGAMRLLKDKGDGNFVLNINNSVSSKQNNITANIESIPGEGEVDTELDDLNSIEDMLDNGAR